MAVIKEVASFDVDTTTAINSINQYIKKLDDLEKQRKENLRLGKSTVAVNKEIANTEKAIVTALNQETQSRKGLNAQLKATITASEKLTQQSKQQIRNLDEQAKKTERNRKSLRETRRTFSDLRFVAVGAVAGIVGALANLQTGLDSVNNLLFPQIGLQNKLAEATSAAAVEYVKEKGNLDALVETAADDTRSREERNAAIQELNNQYGDYLPNLLQEGASLDQLKSAQDAATAAILRGIVARQKAAIAEQLIATIIQGTINQLNRTAQANRGAAEEAEGFLEIAGGAVFQLFDFSEGVANAQNKLDEISVQSATEQLKLLGQISDEEGAEFLSQFDGLADAFADFSTAGEEATQKVDKSVKDLSGTLAGLQKQLSEAQRELKEGIQITDTEELIRQQEEINNLQEQITNLQNLLAGVGEDPVDVTVIPEPIIPEGFNEELEGKIAEQQREITLDQLRIDVERIQTRGIIDVRAIEQARAAALRAFRGTEEERDALNEQFNEQIRARERETAQEVIRLQLRILAIRREAAAQTGEDIASIDKEIAQLRLNLQKLDNEDIKVDIDVDDVDAAKEKIKETSLEIIDGLSQLSDQTLSFFASQAAAAVARLDEQVQKQKSVLDQLLGNQSSANAEQVQLERDRLDALNKKREQAAQRERTIALAQIAINAALTVARAAAEGGGIGSAITIATALLALTFGFIQARASAQNAVQGFSEGTLSVQQKGAKVKGHGKDTVAAVLQPGEAVIPASHNSDYHPAVEAIFNRKIPAKELNDFVRGYGKNAGNLTRAMIPKSVLRQLDENGITLSMLNNGGISKGQMQDMIKEMRGVRQTLEGLPVQRLNITERGLTKTVSRGLDKQKYLDKRFS